MDADGSYIGTTVPYPVQQDSHRHRSPLPHGSEDGRNMHLSMESAREEASSRAAASGEKMCIVSGRKNGRRIFRVYPLKGFGLPAGGILEEVVQPDVERVEPEPPEKTSTNGF